MAKFKCYARSWVEIEIDADDEDQAEEKFIEMLDAAEFDFEFSDNAYIDDVIEIKS